jgi:hypothetical protein
LVYKDMMVVSRFMVMIATALLIAVSLSLGAVATTIAHAPQPHYSSAGAPDHDNCDEAGDQDVSCQGCCHGISCASSGVLAQAAIAVPFMLLISQPEPNATDHLFGRSITPETGPPKLLA